MSSIVTADGQFHFALLPHKAYTVEVEKEGYQVVRYEFKTDTIKGKFMRDFTLDKVLLMATLKTETPDDDDDVSKNMEKKPDSDKNSRVNAEKFNKKDNSAPNATIKTDKKITTTT
ncbi:MAG: carboxypeptidase regulatory-like domain-containing protein, partial [Saprospiraceae bacterium]|nr:carboxypeptidase regulatory-like domain-containing protein [Saprospiraceae bacterium]